MNDLRVAWRQLRQQPGFTAVAVLTLALGIGANTAMFNLLDALLLQPLPYPDSARLVRIFRTSPQSRSWPHSPANFLDRQAQNTVFERTAAFSGASFNCAEPGQPAERLSGILGSGDFFLTLATPPALGRVFTADDDHPGAQHVAVISHAFWQRRFGGDTNVLGQTLRLDGETVTIIGVMPASFGHRLFSRVDVWKPFGWSAEDRANRGSNWLSEFARLKPGVSRARAQAEMSSLAAALARTYPDSNTGIGLRVIPLLDSLTDDTGRRLLWLTFGLTLFVLLIACANLANLLLARSVAREREMAVRAALGAGRWRLARQCLSESLVLAVIGGVLGVVLALVAGKILGSQFIVMADRPGFTLAFNPRILGFALLCTGLTALLFGMMPAWLAARANVNDALRHAGRGATGGRAHHRWRQMLIVGEVALALVLLAGAGLFLQGLDQFRRRDPGWRVDGLLYAHLALTHPKYEHDSARQLFAAQLEQRLSTLPGVRSAALSSTVPLWGFSSRDFVAEGQPVSGRGGERPLTFVETVSPNYFTTFGVRLLEGRVFDAQDRTNRPAVAIINAALARHYWPGQSALGHRLGSGDPADPRWEEIVGVVADVRFPANLDRVDTMFQEYRPIGQTIHRWLTLTLRTDSRAEPMAAAIRRVVAEIDPEMSVAEVEWVRDRLNLMMTNASVLGRVLGVFAALGLFLAALGIYGVISYSVAQRTSEFGLRMALGASRQSVLWLVLRKGILLSGAGAALGLVGAMGVARLLAAAAPEIPSHRLAVVAVVALALIGLAIVACWWPARRATLVNPMEALRHE
jgi:predicted permease